MAERHVMEHFTAPEEHLLREFLFTNPYGNIGFLYPQELVAGEELSPLLSAYSRTHVPFTDRVMQFLDQEKPEESRFMLGIIPGIMRVFRKEDGTLRLTPKTRGFNDTWVLKHGHGSIKEETPILGYVEQVSDITGKKITGDARNRPQVKSTRYLYFQEFLDLALSDPDIGALREADRFLEHIKYMNGRYMATTQEMADFVFAQPVNQRFVAHLRSNESVEAAVQHWVAGQRRKNPSFVPTPGQVHHQGEQYLDAQSDDAVRDQMLKFVLDYSRGYLTAANRTSMGFSCDDRVLEDIITDLLSSPRQEDQSVGQQLWGEAKKVSPVLMGERSHIRVDRWKQYLETEFRAFAMAEYGHLPSRAHQDMVALLSPWDVEMYTDRFNAAQALYPYVDTNFLTLMTALRDEDIGEVLRRAHHGRGEFDTIHPDIAHGGFMVEMTMPFHAYRDMYRHRRGSRSTQLLSASLGFEVPELITLMGLEEQFSADMLQNAELVRQGREENPHAAEKLVAFAQNNRALHSWAVNQLGYVGRLRSDMGKGNRTYVRMTRELIEQASSLMPLTGQHFRVGQKEYPPELWKKGYQWYDGGKR